MSKTDFEIYIKCPECGELVRLYSRHFDADVDGTDGRLETININRSCTYCESVIEVSIENEV